MVGKRKKKLDGSVQTISRQTVQGVIQDFIQTVSLLLDPEPDKCWSLLIPANNVQLYFGRFCPFQTKQHCTCRNYFTYLDVLKIRTTKALPLGHRDKELPAVLDTELK